MGDSLPAINVDQLTDSVNTAVHGNLLPPFPLLPVPPPPPPPPPPTSVLQAPGFADACASRLPGVPGLPPLPMFSPLPAFPLCSQVSDFGQAAPIPSFTITVTDSGHASSSTSSGTNRDNLPSSSSAASTTATTTSDITTTTTSFTASMSQVSSSVTTTCASDNGVSSGGSGGGGGVSGGQLQPPLFPQSLPVSLPGCPPMFVMFSLRLPVPESFPQSGSQDCKTPAPQGLPPRLPPFPPFPLLLPFLPPSQDGQQPPRPLLPLPDLPAPPVPASASGGLPLPTILPLPPLPLQLPASLPPLPIPAQTPSVTQGDYPLPPLLLQPSVSGCPASLPLPPFLPPPPPPPTAMNSAAAFPCPPSPPPLSHSPTSAGQAALPLPPFPPQSFAAFVQSGLPLTSLSSSSLSLPPLISRPVGSAYEGSQLTQSQSNTLQSTLELQPSLPPAGLDKAYLPCVSASPQTFTATAFPPAGFPHLPPLTSASSFPLLPPLPMSSVAEGVFPLPLSLALPPPPFSLPGAVSDVSSHPHPQPPLFASAAGQSKLPAFPSQLLPPLPTLLPESSAVPPPVIAFPDHSPTGAPLQIDLDRAMTLDSGEQSLDKESESDFDRAKLDASSTTHSNEQAGDESMDTASSADSDHQAALNYLQVHSMEAASDKGMDTSESAECSGKHLAASGTVHDLGESTHALGTLFSGGREGCRVKNTTQFSTQSQSGLLYSTAAQASSHSCSYAQLPAVSDPQGSSQSRENSCLLQSSNRYELPGLSTSSTDKGVVPVARQDPCPNFQQIPSLAHDDSVNQQPASFPHGYLPVMAVSPQEKATGRGADLCPGSYLGGLTGAQQGKAVDKAVFHNLKTSQGDASAGELPLPSFYHLSGSQPVDPNCPSLQPLPDRQYSFVDSLSSCSLDAHGISQSEAQKRQMLDPNAVFLSSITDTQQTGFAHQDPSFAGMAQSGAILLPEGEPTAKLSQSHSHSHMPAGSVHHPCQFHASLNMAPDFNFPAPSAPVVSVATDFNFSAPSAPTVSVATDFNFSAPSAPTVSVATDFNFSAPSAPTVSVDAPSQAMLPSVGYSPPGLSNQGLSPHLSNQGLSPHLSNQGLSPHLFSPGLDKVDPSLQGSSAAGAGLGLSAMSVSVLDMLLMKADLASVDKGAVDIGPNLSGVEEACCGGTPSEGTQEARHDTAAQPPVPPLSGLQQAVTGATAQAEVPSTAEMVATSVDQLVPVFSGQFCVECGRVREEACKHGPSDCCPLADAPVLTKARATLPDCLRLDTSAVTGHFNNTGVFTKAPLKSKTEFGPLQGKVVEKAAASDVGSFSLWKVFYKGSVRRLDISDENEANWLMFVKPARNAMERNVVAFQRGHDIVFLTMRDVAQDTELLFWFAHDYCKMLSEAARPPQFCPYCPTCGQVFYERAQVQRHCRQAHGGEGSAGGARRWGCSLCPTLFRSAARLNDHVMTRHMNLRPHPCPTCGKEFADPRNLNTHMALHTGIKRFGCETCGKYFMQKAHLQSHMATHTKVKAAQCRFCSKQFVRQSDMRQHELKHTKSQSHGCPQCTKTFHRPELLRRHLKSVHSNERNYLCERCSKTFHTKYKLSRHAASCVSRKIQPAPSPPLAAPPHPQQGPGTEGSSHPEAIPALPSTPLMAIARNPLPVSAVDVPPNHISAHRMQVSSGEAVSHCDQSMDVQPRLLADSDGEAIIPTVGPLVPAANSDSAAVSIATSLASGGLNIATSLAASLMSCSSGKTGNLGNDSALVTGDVLMMPAPPKGPGLTQGAMPALIHSAG